MAQSTVLHGFGRGLGLLIMIVLLAALAHIVVFPPLIHAQSYQVDTTADNPALTNCMVLVPGDCSLRGAISRANGSAGADTITFAAATNGVPIILAGSAGEQGNAEGDLDILAAGGDLLIQGNGEGNTIIDGGGIDRVFHVCPNGCSNEVSLTGVTIRKGYTLGKGGGIQNNGANLLVQSSAIGGAGFGNTALSGGGIANEAGTTTVDGSTVSANVTGFQGGGIYNAGELLVRNGSTIGGAGGANDAGSVGGGIYNLEGTTTVDDSTIASNTAVKGGGVYNTGTLVIQNGSTVGGDETGNDADEEGGGIYNADGGSATVDGSTISGNHAVDGGGIYNGGTLAIQSSSMVGEQGASNTADDEGGGIYNSDGGTTTVDGSTVTASLAVWGGGVYNVATLNVRNGSTIGGAEVGNWATAGAGVYNLGTTTVDGSAVSENIAADIGGGILNQGTLNVQNGSTIGGDNDATNYGGGILNSVTGTVTVDGSSISANTSDYGGGIHNEGALVIRNGSTIGGVGTGNEATYGGGISTSGGTTTLDGSTVSANEATDGGGGLYNARGTVLIRNSSTIGGAGAANQASYGGGIATFRGTITLDGSTVSANVATGDGGGIENFLGTLIVRNGSTIGGAGAGNEATDYGGGIYSRGDITVDGSTISDNTAGEHGGGIYTWGGTTMVTGSRILYNDAAAGGGVYNSVHVAGATNVTGSCIVGNSEVSFFSNRAAQQIATSNWWGASTGPNTPGADTTEGNVDTSHFLTASILGCAPDLRVDKANDAGGVAAPGIPFAWNLTVSNNGEMDAVFAAGERILVDELPPGPAYGLPVAGSFVSVIGSDHLGCGLAANTLTCEATGGSVTLGAGSGSFAITLPATPSDNGVLHNPAGDCGVDPDGHVAEGDETNNVCPEDVVVIGPGSRRFLPLVQKQ